MKTREKEIEELLRSACAIAERKGDDTNWRGFIQSVNQVGLNGITARTYREVRDDAPMEGLKVSKDLELLEARSHSFDGKVVIEVRCPSGVSVLSAKDAKKLALNITNAIH
jgi:hypothetical protein